MRSIVVEVLLNDVIDLRRRLRRKPVQIDVDWLYAVPVAVVDGLRPAHQRIILG